MVPEMDGRHIRHPEHLVGGTVLIVEHVLGQRRDRGRGCREVAAGGVAAAENLQRQRQQLGLWRHYRSESLGFALCRFSPLLFLPPLQKRKENDGGSPAQDNMQV